ncbi:MAG: hypothetical protein M1549_00380 [Candidatus Dependentiae bacterium]|nr:hypothetical protein [Candidatus Dependentiae bacterium]
MKKPLLIIFCFALNLSISAVRVAGGRDELNILDYVLELNLTEPLSDLAGLGSSKGKKAWSLIKPRKPWHWAAELIIANNAIRLGKKAYDAARDAGLLKKLGVLSVAYGVNVLPKFVRSFLEGTDASKSLKVNLPNYQATVGVLSYLMGEKNSLLPVQDDDPLNTAFAELVARQEEVKPGARTAAQIMAEVEKLYRWDDGVLEMFERIRDFDPADKNSKAFHFLVYGPSSSGKSKLIELAEEYAATVWAEKIWISKNKNQSIIANQTYKAVSDRLYRKFGSYLKDKKQKEHIPFVLTTFDEAFAKSSGETDNTSGKKGNNVDDLSSFLDDSAKEKICYIAGTNSHPDELPEVLGTRFGGQKTDRISRCINLAHPCKNAVGAAVKAKLEGQKEVLYTTEAHDALVDLFGFVLAGCNRGAVYDAIEKVLDGHRKQHLCIDMTEGGASLAITVPVLAESLARAMEAYESTKSRFASMIVLSKEDAEKRNKLINEAKTQALRYQVQQQVLVKKYKEVLLKDALFLVGDAGLTSTIEKLEKFDTIIGQKSSQSKEDEEEDKKKKLENAKEEKNEKMEKNEVKEKPKENEESEKKVEGSIFSQVAKKLREAREKADFAGIKGTLECYKLGEMKGPCYDPACAKKARKLVKLKEYSFAEDKFRKKLVLEVANRLKENEEKKKNGIEKNEIKKDENDIINSICASAGNLGEGINGLKGRRRAIDRVMGAPKLLSDWTYIGTWLSLIAAGYGKTRDFFFSYLYPKKVERPRQHGVSRGEQLQALARVCNLPNAEVLIKHFMSVIDENAQAADTNFVKACAAIVGAEWNAEGQGKKVTTDLLFQNRFGDIAIPKKHFKPGQFDAAITASVYDDEKKGEFVSPQLLAQNLKNPALFADIKQPQKS